MIILLFIKLMVWERRGTITIIPTTGRSNRHAPVRTTLLIRYLIARGGRRVRSVKIPMPRSPKTRRLKWGFKKGYNFLSRLITILHFKVEINCCSLIW